MKSNITGRDASRTPIASIRLEADGRKLRLTVTDGDKLASVLLEPNDAAFLPDFFAVISKVQGQ